MSKMNKCYIQIGSAFTYTHTYTHTRYTSLEFCIHECEFSCLALAMVTPGINNNNNNFI